MASSNSAGLSVLPFEHMNSSFDIHSKSMEQLTVKHALLNTMLNQGHKQGIKSTKKSWFARQFTWKIPWCYAEGKLCLVALVTLRRLFPLPGHLQVELKGQANHLTWLMVRKKSPPERFCTSLFGTRSVPCTFNLCIHISSAPKLPQSADCAGVPAQVGHSHLCKSSRDAARPAVHPAQSALGWCCHPPLSVATPKKEGKEACPTLWSQKILI